MNGFKKVVLFLKLTVCLLAQRIFGNKSNPNPKEFSYKTNRYRHRHTELFIIISSKYKRPVPSKFKEKLMGHLRGSKIKPTKYLLTRIVATQKSC